MWPEAIVSWILAAAFVGFLAGRIQRSQVVWTLVSLCFSPPVGLISLLVVGDGETAGAEDDASDAPRRKCANSDGAVFPADRAECPHCGAVIDAGDRAHPRLR